MADPDRHKNPFVAGVRNATTGLVKEARAAAVTVGYPDLSAWTVNSWRWLTRQPGASEPCRPEDPADVARQHLQQAAAAIDALDGADPEAVRLLAADIVELSRRFPGPAAT